MGMKANSGYFLRTNGALKYKLNIQYFASKIFRKDGHTDYRRIADNRELFYDKSVSQISNAMKEQGYETTIRKSTHSGSNAKFIVVGNSNKSKNITTVEVSPGTPRHGNVPYVRISTSDLGKFKVINGTKTQYKTDGSEKSKLIFKRRMKNDINK